ncbi:unnamed protein product [Paramecium sonneborni]|uniref:Uncharacterized protein n=1 Tax=Paramecium sonneborni TaxID=65129 RepID=A0A8S1QWQ4_9CILI|nr:unnamed protein product [Paramecium sonneborni]
MINPIERYTAAPRIEITWAGKTPKSKDNECGITAIQEIPTDLVIRQQCAIQKDIMYFQIHLKIWVIYQVQQCKQLLMILENLQQLLNLNNIQKISRNLLQINRKENIYFWTFFRFTSFNRSSIYYELNRERIKLLVQQQQLDHYQVQLKHQIISWWR